MGGQPDEGEDNENENESPEKFDNPDDEKTEDNELERYVEK